MGSRYTGFADNTDRRAPLGWHQFADAESERGVLINSEMLDAQKFQASLVVLFGCAHTKGTRAEKNAGGEAIAADPEKDRRRYSAKSIQSRTIARQPGVTGFSKCLGEAPRQRGAFSFRDIIGLRAG